MLVALGVAPAAQATRGGDHDYVPPVKVKVIATGLDSPRHLAFNDDGDLFVAEAGRGGTGPCFAGGEGPACMGATGAVTKIDRRGHQYRIVSGLASMANTPNNDNAIGPHGLIVTRDDHVLITNGGPNEPKDAAGNTIFRETLVRTSGTTSVTSTRTRRLATPRSTPMPSTCSRMETGSSSPTPEGTRSTPWIPMAASRTSRYSRTARSTCRSRASRCRRCPPPS
jgi:hypothetical protein